MNRPVPSVLKVLRGNPGKRRLNPDEPHPEATDVQPPSDLSPEALARWESDAPKLLAVGLLTEVDVNVFAAYCQTSADYWKAVEKVRQFGEVVVVNATRHDKDGKPKNGTPAQSPWVKMRDASLARMQSLAVEFGMTASARSRVHVTGRAKKSAAQRFQASAPKLRAVK